MKKLSNTEAELEKNFAYKKNVYLSVKVILFISILFFSVVAYTTWYSGGLGLNGKFSHEIWSSLLYLFSVTEKTHFLSCSFV